MKKPSCNTAVKEPDAVRYQGYDVVLSRITEEIGDRFFMWCLRTSPRGMACSRSKEPIPYEQHLDWLARFEANPDQAVYLLVLPGMHRLRIGYGHIKAVSEWACEISYILSEQACGLGIGRWLVREICREAKETFLYREISATVGIHNWASRKILERNGFALKDAGQEYAIYHKGL